MLMCVTIASNFGKLNFAFDLLAHFKVHYAALFVLFGIIFWVFWQPFWLALSLVGAIANLAAIGPWYLNHSSWQKADSTNAISVLISNVARGRGSVAELLKLTQLEQPDIVGLVEVPSQLLKDFISAQTEYKYKIEYPQDYNHEGLALFSKLPITESEIVRFGETTKPTIVAHIDTGDHSLEVILAHPVWPMGAEYSARRNLQLLEMAEYVRTRDGTVLIAGDLNITIWSPYYREFVERSGLADARTGFGIGATYPAAMAAFGIPIDHILITEPSRVGNFRVLNSIGSDHLPISAEVSLLPKNRG